MEVEALYSQKGIFGAFPSAQRYCEANGISGALVYGLHFTSQPTVMLSWGFSSSITKPTVYPARWHAILIPMSSDRNDIGGISPVVEWYTLDT